MGDYADLLNAQHATPAARKKRTEATPPAAEAGAGSPSQTSERPAGQPANRSGNQLAKQPTNRSTDQPTSRPRNRIVDRPKAFYISERLDQRLDEAVRYLQSRHHIRKVDRSILVTALLDDEALWTDDALDQLVGRVVDQLTSRLTGQ